MSRKLLSYAVLALSVVFAISPFLTQDFSGYPDDALPIPQPDPVIQPAGWAFSIWGLIYLWLIIGSAYGALMAGDSSDWHPMRLPLAFSLLIGVFWLPVANSAPVIATIMIALMAAGAIVALLKCGTENPLLQRTPVALYAGWLTAATGVSLSIVLAGFGVLDPLIAGIGCLVIALAVALAVQAARPDAIGYAAAVCWALVAIVIDSYGAGMWSVVGLAALGLLVIGGRAILLSMRGSRADAP